MNRAPDVLFFLIYAYYADPVVPDILHAKEGFNQFDTSGFFRMLRFKTAYGIIK